MASERYRRNNIPSLTTDSGYCAEDHASKEAIIFQTFKDRLGTKTKDDMNLDLPRLIKKIDGLDELTVPFTVAEITTTKTAIANMATNGALYMWCAITKY